MPLSTHPLRLHQTGAHPAPLNSDAPQENPLDEDESMEPDDTGDAEDLEDMEDMELPIDLEDDFLIPDEERVIDIPS